jgi:hypothetical protein
MFYSNLLFLMQILIMQIIQTHTNTVKTMNSTIATMPRKDVEPEETDSGVIVIRKEKFVIVSLFIANI